MSSGIDLELLPDIFAVCRLKANSPLPDIPDGKFFSMTKTEDELSLVCLEDHAPAGSRMEKGWRCLKVRGPLDFSLTGILASLADPLARAGISIFAQSTYDTDYLLVRSTDMDSAAKALERAGHRVER